MVRYNQPAYYPIVKVIMYGLPITLIFLGIYAVLWPIDAIAKAVNDILKFITGFLLFGFFVAIFKVGIDASGRARGKGVWMPKWLFYSVILFVVMATLVISLFVWEPLSPVLAIQIAESFKEQGFPVTVTGLLWLMAIVLLDFHSSVRK